MVIWVNYEFVLLFSSYYLYLIFINKIKIKIKKKIIKQIYTLKNKFIKIIIHN